MFLFLHSYPVRTEKVFDLINEADALTLNIPLQQPPHVQPREEVTFLHYQKGSKQLPGIRVNSQK